MRTDKENARIKEIKKELSKLDKKLRESRTNETVSFIMPRYQALTWEWVELAHKYEEIREVK